MRAERNRSWMKWLAAGVAAVLLAGAVWLGGSRFIAPMFSGKDLTVGVTDLPSSLDIRSADSDALNRLLIDNVYETLVTVDEQNTLQPGLASSWTTSNDGLTWTFTLRQGVTFSNGHALDAADVVTSLQHAVQQSYPHVDDLGNLANVSNPDATTVTITLTSPNPKLARTLAGPLGIVYDADASYDYATAAVGSGPFTVRSFDAGKTLTLERNGTYWGTKAASKRITVKQYADAETLANALIAGDVDVDASVDASKSDELKNASGITLTEGATTTKVLLAYNNSTDSLMSDEQIRKAFRYLVNAAELAKTQPDAYAALGGPISQLEPGYEDLTGLFPYDLDQAKTMLGYFDLSFLPSVNLVAREKDRSLAEAIAKQIGEVAYPPVKLEILSDDEYNKRIAAGTWELTITTMSGTDDCGTFADPNSMFHYDHTDAEKLYENAIASTSDADWTTRIKTFAKYVSEDAASHWLYTRKCLTAAKTSVSGYPTAMTDQRLPLVALK